MTCNCASIGAPKDIRFCEEHHKYFLGDRQLDSVSRVIRALLPTDYSAVKPEVLENARLRGEKVDQYFSEYLTTGTTTVPPEHFESRELFLDVKDRLGRLIDWFDRTNMKPVAVQQIVYDEVDGIAGTLDLRMEDGAVVDLKCVSKLQPSYSLQLGSYCTYGKGKAAGIIHVTKEDCRFVPYNAERCMDWWAAAVTWWTASKEIR